MYLKRNITSINKQQKVVILSNSQEEEKSIKEIPTHDKHTEDKYSLHHVLLQVLHMKCVVVSKSVFRKSSFPPKRGKKPMRCVNTVRVRQVAGDGGDQDRAEEGDEDGGGAPGAGGPAVSQHHLQVQEPRPPAW